MELSVNKASNENIKLSRQVGSLNRRLEDLDKESNDIEAENRNMMKTIENLKIQARRVNKLESENLELEGGHHKVERENKSLVRELERLRQSMEVKDLSLDEAAVKLASLERWVIFLHDILLHNTQYTCSYTC